MFVVGGVHVSVAEPVATACTVSVNAASDALSVAVADADDDAARRADVLRARRSRQSPVAVSNDAHAGAFVMLNVNVSPSGSLAVGVKEYAVPARRPPPGRAADRRRAVRRLADDDRERRELRRCPGRR